LSPFKLQYVLLPEIVKDSLVCYGFSIEDHKVLKTTMPEYIPRGTPVCDVVFPENCTVNNPTDRRRKRNTAIVQLDTGEKVLIKWKPWQKLADEPIPAYFTLITKDHEELRNA